MFKLLTKLLVLSFILVSILLYYNSQRTFQAKFKNIDGLPIGAQVTALGVKVGEVIRTKAIHDGIVVTIRITNKRFESPAPGSQLAITAFRPNQGRVLEIVPPKDTLNETESWIVQEPITTESWLHASIELLEGLKSFSNVIIKNVTPENFTIVRQSFSNASESLNQIANKLAEYESNLVNVKEKLSVKANEANALLLRLQEPIKSLNKIINDKDLISSLDDLNGFSKNLAGISKDISSEDFLNNLTSNKTMILTRLNEINASLIKVDQELTNSDLKQKIKNFNNHITNLNTFNEMIQVEDIRKVKQIVKEARDITTKASEETSML